MLKLTPDPTFKLPVEITVPGAEKPAIVTVEYRHKDRTALADFVERYRDKKISDEDALDEVIVAWDGVDAPYSRDALKKLALNYPAAPLELMESYAKASTESRRKNSAR